MRFCIILFLLSTTAAGAATPPELDAFLNMYRAGLKKYGIVGSSFALIQNGEVVSREYYGDAVRETGRKVDENTTFHWASITKTFTGIAIMQLRDRGMLQLDDPVVKYVPELRAIHDPYGPVEAITIRQLMTHSAGFRSPTWPWSGDKPWEPFEPTKWSQIVAMLPYTEVLFPPGSKHSYSNLGVVFLGQIIERLTDDDYEVYIDKNILKPLEMYRSYFDQSPYYLLKNRAAGYYQAGGAIKAAPFNFDSGITVSNSGLNAPIPDMLKYLRFLIGDPKNEIYEQVLKRESLEEMFRKQLPLTSTDPSQGKPAAGRDWVGLSFFLHEDGGRLYVGHGGQQGGFISHFFVDVAGRSAYIVAFNTDITDGLPNTQTLDGEISDFLIHKIFHPNSAH
ncbi:MAG: serine hydrolase domain-containing protein [Bryobacteraceae bacterium]|jgi:CubicO group peptidase (beta-lactamase class C family)